MGHEGDLCTGRFAGMLKQAAVFPFLQRRDVAFWHELGDSLAVGVIDLAVVACDELDVAAALERHGKHKPAAPDRDCRIQQFRGAERKGFDGFDAEPD